MKNKDKIIIDLCAGSGAWSKKYREKNYDVRLVTLPSKNVLTYKPPKNIYGILAAPPCTQFSYARTQAPTPRNLQAGMKIVSACRKIIEECYYAAYRAGKISSLKFWALENPYYGYLVKLLGKPAYTFQPCDFGDPYTKKTALWGFFNTPIQSPIKLTSEQIKESKTNSRKLPSISDLTSGKQSAQRAVTPEGFAEAFFEANK